MKRDVIKGAMLCLLALAAGGLVVVVSGVAPIKASSGHWPVTQSLLEFAMRRSIATQSLGIKAPALDIPGLVLKGAGHYEGGCRSCHGAPGLEQSRIARSMLPRPPTLSERVTGKRPGELFFAVKHGLKFTGMPAWAAEGRDDEVWAVVAFLTKLPELEAGGYRRLVYGDPAPVPARRAPSQEVPSPVAQTCARCHGSDGMGRGAAATPVLAGQRRAYLEGALKAYAAGERHSGIMEPAAASLDLASIRLLAAYYSGLKPPTKKAAPDAGSVARGRVLAEKGLRARRIPACVSCHGPDKKTKDEFPSLAGQPADYLALQLELMSKDQRGGSKYSHLMQPIAARLTPEQVRDVSVYYGSLP